MLDEILSNSLGNLLRSRGGNFESSVGRKGLIVNLAALVGKTGHSGRDHVCKRLAIEPQHQSGCAQVLGG